jgi:hypothetical protein
MHYIHADLGHDEDRHSQLVRVSQIQLNSDKRDSLERKLSISGRCFARVLTRFTGRMCNV